MVESRACPPVEIIWLHFKLLDFLVSIPWSNIINVRAQFKFGIALFQIIKYIPESKIHKYFWEIIFCIQICFLLKSNHQLLFCICVPQLNSNWYHAMTVAYSVFANKPLPQEVIEFNSSASLPSVLSIVHQIFDVDTV